MMTYDIDTEHKKIFISRNNPAIFSNLAIYLLIGIGYTFYLWNEPSTTFWFSLLMYLLLPVFFMLMTYKVFFLDYRIENDIVEVKFFKKVLKRAPLSEVKFFVRDFTSLPDQKESNPGIFIFDIKDQEYNIANLTLEQFNELKLFFETHNIELTHKENIRR